MYKNRASRYTAASEMYTAAAARVARLFTRAHQFVSSAFARKSSHALPPYTRALLQRESSRRSLGSSDATGSQDGQKVTGRVERFDTRVIEPFELLRDQNSVKFLSEFRNCC